MLLKKCLFVHLAIKRIRKIKDNLKFIQVKINIS